MIAMNHFHLMKMLVIFTFSSKATTTQSTTETTTPSGSSSSTTSTTSSNDACNSTSYSPNTQDCTKFYRCVDNQDGTFTKYEFDCAPGTAWNDGLQTCNYIEQVAACNGTTTTTTTQPTGKIDIYIFSVNKQSAKVAEESNKISSKQQNF